MRIAIKYATILLITNQFTNIIIDIKDVEFTLIIQALQKLEKYFIAQECMEKKRIDISYKGNLEDFFAKICPILGYKVILQENLLSIKTIDTKNYYISVGQDKFKIIETHIKSVMGSGKCIGDAHKGLFIIDTSVETHKKIQNILDQYTKTEQLYFKILCIEVGNENLAEIGLKLENLFNDPYNAVSGKFETTNTKVLWSGQVSALSGEKAELSSLMDEGSIKLIISPIASKDGKITANISLNINHKKRPSVYHKLLTNVELEANKLHLIGSTIISKKSNGFATNIGHNLFDKRKIAFYIKCYYI